MHVCVFLSMCVRVCVRVCMCLHMLVCELRVNACVALYILVFGFPFNSLVGGSFSKTYRWRAQETEPGTSCHKNAGEEADV
jgi:hypothetical protein